MTRINVVEPRMLTGKHLVAEYRELPRVFGLVRHAQYAGKTPDDYDIPDAYLLGKGHVTFFYDKLLWLSWRHVHLVNEMQRRDYEPKFTENLRVTHSDLSSHWWGDWVPDDNARQINLRRLRETSGNASCYQTP